VLTRIKGINSKNLSEWYDSLYCSEKFAKSRILARLHRTTCRVNFLYQPTIAKKVFLAYAILRTELLSKGRDLNTPYPQKPKNNLRPANSISLGTFFLACLMVLVGIIIGGSTMLLAAPTIFNMPATQAALGTQRAQLESQAQNLVATEVELHNIANNNELLATKVALQLEATRSSQQANVALTTVALANEQTLLLQTATQSQNNVLATQTALAVLDANQRTQVALDYSATQVALNFNATQVELAYQATRSALNGTPVGAQSQLVQATNTPITPMPITPLATTTPVALAPTRPADAPLLADEFSNGVSPDVWFVSDTQAWQSTAVGLKAQTADAWLVSKASLNGDYVLTLVFTPAIVTNATYDILLNTSNGDGLLVRLTVNTLQISKIGLYRFDGGLPIQRLGETFLEQAVSARVGSNATLTLNLRDKKLQILLNNAELLPSTAVTIPTSGAIGVQLPKDATITRITVSQP
jgi:uncharacterized membrane-anchored protein YhcB (DUF1043 family)